MSDSSVIELARELIRRRSVTPEDAGCQDVLRERLEALGFRFERMDAGGVQNAWARRGGDGPLLAFAGHTDVVPTGPEAEWRHPPFEGVTTDRWLHGRGAADMKGSLAAMVVAVEQFLDTHPGHRGSIGFLITSDEEGPAVDGTRHVMTTLADRGEAIDWCLVGEPSSRDRLGDVIRRGRRGSLNGHLVVKGKLGHVAYPGQADNPVHRALPALGELVGTHWDDGFESFPPTSFQISNLNAGTGAENVIPGTADVRFNFRYSPAVTAEQLKERVEKTLAEHGVDYTLDWRESGRPFYTGDGRLLDAVIGAVRDETGRDPELSTGGGTSDGRYIAPHGVDVVELGPVNATIHAVNERVAVDDLTTLARLYRNVLERLLAGKE